MTPQPFLNPHWTTLGTVVVGPNAAPAMWPGPRAGPGHGAHGEAERPRLSGAGAVPWRWLGVGGGGGSGVATVE